MTIKEFYDAIGADYEEIMGRLRKEERIQKFLLKFLDDKSYELLGTALAQGNMEEAFRAAHTLKGVSQNLSLTPLYVSSSHLSDRLKVNQVYDADLVPMVEEVGRQYEMVVGYIRQL